MQDKTIDNALLALRKQIIRDNLDGLAHVEALLSIRGVPLPRVQPPRRKDVARQGEMRGIIGEALREGPMTLRQLSERVVAVRGLEAHRPTYNRVSRVLWKMQGVGLVRREGQAWCLTPPAANTLSRPG